MGVSVANRVKLLIAGLLVTVFSAGVIVTTPQQAWATTMTADEAIAWAKSKEGLSVGVDDGSHYYQCIEFIRAYYEALGASPVSGSGADYAWNTLPDPEWTRIEGGTPQKGDILVYSGDPGHVAIYESDNSIWDQDGNQYDGCVKHEEKYYLTYTPGYWGCIHPNFKTAGDDPEEPDEPDDPEEQLEILKSIWCGDDYFYYSDKMILSKIGETQPSGEIALASVGLAVGAYDKDIIRSALSIMEFTELYTSDYYDTLSTHDNNDVVAYTVYEKYVDYNGETFRIVIVPIRGTPQTCEWYSDFNIGSGSQHAGFYAAAGTVLDNLYSLLSNSSDNADHTVIWTMGHSRGAAVANIVAGEISTSSAWQSITSSDYVFGYTFACPAVSKTANQTLHNIFNYNNGGDVVPTLPLAEWGFARFGQTITLPESDYNNFCQRFKAEMGEEYDAGMSTIGWRGVLNDLAPTQEAFVDDDKIQLGVDMLAWCLGGKSDESRSLLDVVLSHPCANAEIVGGVLQTAIFPKSTLESMTYDMSAASLQLMLDSDENEYITLETQLITAISDTAEMSSYDSSDEETHRAYLLWCNWKTTHGRLISSVEDMTNIKIETKADLATAKEAAAERYEDYKGLVSTIRDVISLFYDTNGNVAAAFSKGHPQMTYLLWVNSMYYGYEGWKGNSWITTVNWAGRDQKSFVGESCFQNCSALETVVVPSNMHIGRFAFANCENLANVDLAGRGIAIYRQAFEDCDSIVSLVIPDDIAYVGSCAFQYCDGMESVTTPLKEPEYYGDAFYNNDSIRHVTITKGADGEYYDLETECDYFHDWYSKNSTIEHITIAEGVKSLSGNEFSRFDNVSVIELPSSLERVGANTLFGSCNEKVIFHGTLEDWCGIVFEDMSSTPLYYGCPLFIGDEQVIDLVLPEGLSEVGDFAFFRCSGLESVTVAGTGTKIGEGAFADCDDLQSVSFAGSKVSIGDHAFNGCDGIHDVVIPDDVAHTGYCSFGCCQGLETISMPFESLDGGSVIEAFGDDDWDGSIAYWSYTLKKLTITPGLDGEYYNHQGSTADFGCDSIELLTIAEGVKSLGWKDLEGYDHINVLELPASLERVNSTVGSPASAAFEPNLEKVTFNGTIADWCNIDWGESELGQPLKNGCALYIGNKPVVDLVIPDGVTEIKDFSFHGCTSLESVVLPDSIDSIGEWAFYCCSSLTTVSIPDSVSFSTWSFYDIAEESVIYVRGTEIPFGFDATYNPEKTTVQLLGNNISAATISEIPDQTYCGWEITPEITVTLDGKTLVAGIDYDFSYSNNVEVGTATVTIMGINDYSGTKSATFNIVADAPIIKIDIAGTNVAPIPDQTYTGAPIEPVPTVAYEGAQLTLGEEYTVSYSNNVDVGTATVTITGKGDYTGTKVTTFEIVGEHVHHFVAAEKQKATCTQDGWTKYQCDGCGESYIETVPATGHDWLEITYAWSIDSSSVTAARICRNDATHTESETANTTSTVTKEPTCTEAGEVTYTAAFANTAFQAQTKTSTIPAKGHVWDEGTVTVEPTIDAEGVMTYTCTVCSETRNEAIPKIVEFPVKADGKTPYRIVSASDSRFILDVAEVHPTAGANVSIWTSNGGANQLFTFTLSDDGYVIPHNVANEELVLDAAGAKPKVGANVSTWTENGGMNQKWSLVESENSPGYYKIASAFDPYYVLDAAGAVPEIGANVSIWYDNGGTNQLWRFVEANDLAYAEVSASGMVRNFCYYQLKPEISVALNSTELVEGTDYVVTYDGDSRAPRNAGSYEVTIEGIGEYSGARDLGTFTIFDVPEVQLGTRYHLVSGFSDDFVLDVAEVMPTAGANVSIWIDNGGENQMFRIEGQGNGYYMLWNEANPELVLDAAGAVPEIGANVSTWTANGGKNQQWVLIPSEDMPDYYAIASASDSSFVLDATGSAPEIGANVSIWSSNGGRNQLWKLVAVE